MGFLSRFTGSAVPAKKAEDDALLVHAMMLMCGADGGFDAEEIETVKAYCAQLPELKDKEWDALYSAAVKILRNYKDLNDSIRSLAGLSTQALKNKCYLLAADIAMSSGDVDENEDRMLDAMQRTMEVDDKLAQKIIEVLTLKYVKG